MMSEVPLALITKVEADLMSAYIVQTEAENLQVIDFGSKTDVGLYQINLDHRRYPCGP